MTMRMIVALFLVAIVIFASVAAEMDDLTKEGLERFRKLLKLKNARRRCRENNRSCTKNFQCCSGYCSSNRAYSSSSGTCV